MMRNPFKFWGRKDPKLKNELSGGVQFHSYQQGDERKTVYFPIDAAQASVLPSIYAATSIITSAMARGTFEVIDTTNYNQPVDHYLNAFLKKPYRDWDGKQFWRYVFDRKVAHRNGYAEIVRGANNRIVEIIPVYDASPGRFFTDFTDANGIRRRRTRSEIFYTNVKPLGIYSNNRTVPADRMLAFHGPHWDGIRSPSPVGTILRQVSTTINALYREGIIALKHGFNDKHNFETSPDMWDTFTDENKELFHQKLQEYDENPVSFRDGAVLLPGLRRAIASSLNTSAFGLDTFQRWLTLEICRVLNAPPRLLYIYSEGQRVEPKLSSTNADFVRTCLAPRAEFIEDQMTSKLLSNQERNRGLRIRLNLTRLMMGTPQEQAELFNILVTRSGALMVNEGRTEILDRPPEEGQDRFINPTGTADQTDETNPNNPPEDPDNAQSS